VSCEGPFSSTGCGELLVLKKDNVILNICSSFLVDLCKN